MEDVYTIELLHTGPARFKQFDTFSITPASADGTGSRTIACGGETAAWLDKILNQHARMIAPRRRGGKAQAKSKGSSSVVNGAKGGRPRKVQSANEKAFGVGI